MISRYPFARIGYTCAAVILAVGVVVSIGTAQSTAARPGAAALTSAQPAASGAPAAHAASAGSRYRPDQFSRRANLYYQMRWGIDSLRVKAVESGELIRFSYRIIDADKASILNDKKLEPFLVDPQARVKLVIPSLEKVGQLRQVSAPVSGRAYWMAFSNAGRHVKPGDRVNVVIGGFHAEGLLVE